MFGPEVLDLQTSIEIRCIHKIVIRKLYSTVLSLKLFTTFIFEFLCGLQRVDVLRFSY